MISTNVNNVDTTEDVIEDSLLNLNDNESDGTDLMVVNLTNTPMTLTAATNNSDIASVVLPPKKKQDNNRRKEADQPVATQEEAEAEGGSEGMAQGAG